MESVLSLYDVIRCRRLDANRRFGGYCLISIALLGYPTSVCGNAGPSDTSATIVGEPSGMINVDILHETLTIDLQPLEVGSPARVEAIYQLNNPNDSQEVDLLFAFGSPDHSECQVTLDGEIIPGEVREVQSLPVQWTPPEWTIVPDEALMPGEDRVLRYAGAMRRIKPYGFQVTLPPGESELRVTYLEQAKTTFARPTMFRQFVYILSPARSWASFGGLDVTVFVPEQWTVKTKPSLKRQGSALSGTYDSLPSRDHLEITLRPPIPVGYAISKKMGIPFLSVVTAGGLLGCCWIGYRIGRRDPGVTVQDSAPSGIVAGRDFLRAISLGLIYGFVLLVGGIVYAIGLDLIFPPDAAELKVIRQLGLSDGLYQIVSVFVVVTLCFIAFSLAFVGNLLCTALTRRRQRRILEGTS